VKGQFAYDFIQHPERLKTPLVRNANGELEAASWDLALDRAAAGFMRAAEEHWPKAVFAIASGRAPNALGIGPASLRQAAMSGDPLAQYEVGLRYASGRDIPQDLVAAFQWHSRAAARGLSAAQFRLAAMYERGQGAAPDIEKARTWYQRAAEQGHVKAMHNLAVLSAGGGRTDYAFAAKWFTEAAERGLADSQFNLAVLHQNGMGVPKDLKAAYKWLSLAARSGDTDAASRLGAIKTQLSPADLRATDAVIEAWRVRSPDPRAAEPSPGLAARP
jgi:localization factor PodJL